MDSLTSSIPSGPLKPQYFTPGLLSALIVSLFLIAILITAMTWMMSLDISYGSFEKKVDNKKLQ